MPLEPGRYKLTVTANGHTRAGNRRGQQVALANLPGSCRSPHRSNARSPTPPNFSSPSARCWPLPRADAGSHRRVPVAPARSLGARARRRGGPRRLGLAREAAEDSRRLSDGRVLEHASRAAEEDEAVREAERRAHAGAVADLRLRHPADAPGARLAEPEAAVPRALEAEGPCRHRVPALGRLRKGLRRPAEGAVLRHQRTHREARLDEALPELLGRVAARSRDGIVYQAYMHELPCQKHEAGAEGFVIAWNAQNGRELWRVRRGLRGVVAAPRRQRRSTSAPGTGTLYALPDSAASAGRCSSGPSSADDQIVAAPAYAAGRLRRDTNGGRVYALNARTGKLSAGTRRPSHASGAASTSTRRPRSPTGGSSSATPTAPSTPSEPGPGICSGRGRSARTSTQRRRSGERRSSSAPGTGTSSRSMRATGSRSLALRRAVLDHWRADGSRRARLLLDVRPLRRRRAPPVKSGPARDVRAERAERRSRLALSTTASTRRSSSDGRRIYISGRNKVYALIPRLAGSSSGGCRRRRSALELKRARARARCLSKARRGTRSGTHGSGKAGRTSKRKNRQRPPRASRRGAGPRGATRSAGARRRARASTKG